VSERKLDFVLLIKKHVLKAKKEGNEEQVNQPLK